MLAQGKLTFQPVNGPVGTEVVATATGLTPNAPHDLEWESADASWNVDGSEFHGGLATEVSSTLASATADSAGNATFAFTVPEHYGYVHNVFLTSAGEEAARQGFVVVPTLKIEPTAGPVGTPITVTMTGVGYRFWEMVWQLLYDGSHTGWMSAITSNGVATAVIPASGSVGLHTLQVLSGAHPVPYLNQQQAPIYNPAVPTVMGALFEITDGPAVWPSAATDQQLPRATSEASASSDAPTFSADYGSGTDGSPIEARRQRLRSRHPASHKLHHYRR